MDKNGLGPFYRVLGNLKGQLGRGLGPDSVPWAHTENGSGSGQRQGLGRAGGLPFGSPYRFFDYSLEQGVEGALGSAPEGWRFGASVWRGASGRGA